VTDKLEFEAARLRSLATTCFQQAAMTTSGETSEVLRQMGRQYQADADRLVASELHAMSSSAMPAAVAVGPSASPVAAPAAR
jgi:hypothetical protein